MSVESTPERLITENAGILLEMTDSVAVIRLHRLRQRNSLSLNTLSELKQILSRLLPRAKVGAIIFTGTGDVFASGADIRELTQLDPRTAHAFAAYGQGVFQMIEDASQLTIAAINGYCLGGGLDLALACDIRVASRTAVFSHPGAKRGIITGWGGTQRLPRIVGKARALELFTTAKQINSQEALNLGLVGSLSDTVLDAALEFAASVTQKKGAEP